MRKKILILLFFGATFAALHAQDAPDPSFRITILQLTGWVADLPSDLRSAILADPKTFLEDYKSLLGVPWDQMVLVDKKHQLPSDYEPSDLVDLRKHGLATARPHERMRQAILPAVLAMDKAARKAGLRLMFSSCYRSWIYQRDLFQHYVNQDGLATAERYSARPGMSQHQLGTVADFGSVAPDFADTPEGKWMSLHAEDFGFSLSYPQGMEQVTGYIWEPWHYRYIGVDACKVQKKWFGDVQQYLLEFNFAHSDDLKKALVQ